MLKINNITKYYQIGKNKKLILDNINLSFKKHELVFILGPSGSGKSTLLNILAGNLKPDSGEIILFNDNITSYNKKQLANYRANMTGNVFQDYNLIEYMTVYDNIMLACNSHKNNIISLLKQLGIYDKRHMIVSKLSGGEKQRVAIVRALINNPSIIFADEPTGALDSKNSLEVMEILKDLSKEKLVIVVSHDNYLANKYADRIINIQDGRCLSDNIIVDNENINIPKRKNNHLKKIIKLAIKNLSLKKTRTTFTSLAISLGVISMSLVINLYSNFNHELNQLESDIVSIFPITISNGEFENLDHKTTKSEDKIIIKKRSEWLHTNKINNNYLSYINSLKEISYLTYDYNISMPLITDSYKLIDNKYLKVIPSNEYILSNYNLLSGRMPSNQNEILLVLDSDNNVDSELLNYFNIDSNIAYTSILNRKIKLITNDNYYLKENDYYFPNNQYDILYNKSDISLTIVGIIKEKELTDNINYIYYHKDLINTLIDINSQSNIVKDIIDDKASFPSINSSKEDILSFLGYHSLPSNINIYVNNLKSKEQVLSSLDNYNNNNPSLIYLDTMSSSIDIVKQFISIITIILILFSIIAITISSLMIGILTNTRVLERKKEIGILSSLGYLKKDIKHLFNIENIIIGLISLLISIISLELLVNPINNIMNNYLSLDNIFNINYQLTFIVFIINLLIIRLSGIIPALKASNMDIIKCIYNR